MTRAFLIVALLLAAAPAFADEDSDLARIPSAIGEAPTPPAPTAAAPGSLFLGDSISVSGDRPDLAVRQPGAGAPAWWHNELSLDGRQQWSVTPDLQLHLSDRFGWTAQNNLTTFSGPELRNDLREAYATWQALPQGWLEAGRINVKNGVALGFNPTDFFKTGSVVERNTQDPAALREGRLGAAMIRAETIQGWGSASLAFAPALSSPQPVPQNAPASLDPQFWRTNASDRELATIALNGVADLEPQLLAYHDANGSKLGANLSHAIGNAIVVYGEWAGGDSPDLIAQAVAYGKQTHTLPSFAPLVPPTDPRSRFQNDASLGGSWTSTDKWTINVEYHYHQGGFSGADWRNWFAIGRTSPPAAAQAWYVRSYALYQNEPVARQEGFVRIDRTDAFIPHLELSALVFADLLDGSLGAQLQAGYDLSDAWSLGAIAATTAGSRRSEYGSVPQSDSLLFSLTRYF